MTIRANRGAQLPVLKVVPDQQPEQSSALSIQQAEDEFKRIDAEFNDVVKRREEAAVALEMAVKRAIGRPSPITRREKDVLTLVRLHLTNQEIADKLCIMERTVKFHVSSLLAKFDADSRNKL